jgi:phage-related minor tail protein
MISVGQMAVFLGLDQSGLDKGLDQAEKTTRSWVNEIGSTIKVGLAGAVIGGVTALTTAVVGIGVAAVSAAGQSKDAIRGIQAQLGLTADEAERLGDIGLRVFGDNLGQSIAEATQTVANARQQLGALADDELQRVAENALKVRDAFGVEAQDGISASKTLMQSFGITSEEAFDFIAGGFQRGLDRSGDFIDTIEEYSTQFANGGADAGQFFSILETGLQGGQLGTDKAADAFKEFRLRIQDGSEATRVGLEQIGISADAFTKRLSDGSMTAVEAFEQVTNRIAKIEEPTIRLQAGAALMGSQFEDLGDSAIPPLDLMKTKLEELGGATDKLNVQYTSLGSMWEGVKRQAIVAIEPIGERLLDVANRVVPIAINAFGGIAQGIPAVFDEILTLAGSFLSSLLSLFGINFGNISDNAGQWGEDTMLQFATGMGNGIAAIMGVINEVASVLVSWFQPNSPPKVAPDIDVWGALTMEEYLKGFSSADFSLLGNTTKMLEGYFRDIVPADDTRLTQFIEGMRNGVVGMIDFIKGGGSATEAMSQLEGKIGDIPEAIEGAIRAEIELAQAHGKVEEAQKRLETAQEGVERASLRVETAQEGVENAQEGVAEASKKVALAQKDVEKAQEGVAEASKKVALAQKGVERAQEGVNRVTKQYDLILGPLRDQLSGLNDELDAVQKGFRKAMGPLEAQSDALDQQRDSIEDAIRLKEIEEELKDSSLSSEEKKLLILEQQQIALDNQIAAEERKQAEAEAAVQAKIEAAEDEIEKSEAAAEAAISAEEAKVEAAESQVKAAQQLVEIEQLKVEKAQEGVKSAQQLVEIEQVKVEKAQAVLKVAQDGVEAEQKKVKAAKDTLDIARENEQKAKDQLTIQQQIVDQHKEQNDLLEERQTQLEKIAKAQEATSKGGGGGGAGISAGASIGTISDQMKSIPETVSKIGGAIETVSTSASRLKDALAPAQEQMNRFKEILSGTTISLDSLYARAKPVIDVITMLGVAWAAFSVITPIVTAVTWLGTLAGAVGAFATSVAGAGGASAALSALVALLGGPVTVAIGAVSALIGLFTVAWINDWGDIQNKTNVAWMEYIKPALDGIYTLITTVLIPKMTELWTQWVTVWWPQIQASIATAWEDYIKPAITWIYTFVSDTLIPKMTELWTQWVTVWWPQIQLALENSWTIIQTILTEFHRWFNENLVPIALYFYEQWTLVWWPAIQNSLMLAWMIMQPIFEAVKRFFDDLLIKVKPALDAMAMAFQMAGNAMMAAYNATIGQIIKWIKDFWAWLTSATFKFNFEIPDLPDWLIPHSPIPLHTRWKEFHDFLQSAQFKPQFAIPPVAQQSVAQSAQSMLPSNGIGAAYKPVVGGKGSGDDANSSAMPAFSPTITINSNSAVSAEEIAALAGAEMSKFQEKFVQYIRRTR